MRIPLFPTMLCVALFSTGASASGFHATAEIDSAVAALTGKVTGQPGGAQRKVDPRLRLAQCPVEPLAEWYGNDRGNVKVACPVAGGWKVYVALNAGAKAAAVVARGDLVQLRVAGDGFSVSGRAEALEAGAPGETISVRLVAAEKRQIVRGQVLDAGVVGIALP